jgi:hypothetical protein
MPFENVTIEAVAYELPSHRITSASLEEQVADTMKRLSLEPGRLARAPTNALPGQRTGPESS